MRTVEIEITENEKHFFIDCIRFATSSENMMAFQQRFGVMDKDIDTETLEDKLLDA